jgi:hypothetical protein
MRVTYSGVTATLALTLAISTGGAYAANTLLPKNAVTTTVIKNGQVKTKDLGKNSINSAKVRPDALTGADVKESTLGTVPAATTADRASSAGVADRAATAGHADSTAVADRVSSILLAAVDDNGEFVSGLSRGVVGFAVPHAADSGQYVIQFDRPVSGCLYQATVGGPRGSGVNEGVTGMASVRSLGGGPVSSTVLVVETFAGGTTAVTDLEAKPFMLTVFC